MGVSELKRFAPSLLMLLAGLNATAADQVLRHDWKRHFAAYGVEGTFVLFDPEANSYGVHNVVRVRHGYLPASTFKIPNALIGLEVGSIRDEREVFRWDGHPKPRAALERDHTLDSGMKDSVAWMFQEVAHRTGKARMKEWLAQFEYGNQSIEGGIEHFWLQGGLRVSAMEQMEFLRKLEEGRLPVSARSRRLVRDALRIEETAGGLTLYAKTGTTGAVREPVAWWVGWVERRGVPVAYFAMNVTPTKAEPLGAREAITRAILAQEIGYGL
ncbi:class D beta-lactamase [Usitatibacter palustris]|uniref:Beta-lactamase n=1 Tax=Usitatibacter palustris TaxID=2732487 RepID=A0A6M4HB31_9PROT|nr:class D beta-lactamase [Usitatibacter palustris]QJR16796.1 Beta-lactamase OXA-10 [Usitatibacter palustris]